MQLTTLRDQRGVAVVEAALTILVFFMLLFGIMEAGRVLSMQQTLTDAAREGARLGCAPDAGTTNLPSTAEIETEVRRFLRATAITGETISVNAALVEGDGTVYTQVSVSATHDVIALAPLFSDLQLTLTGTSKMRNETSP